MCTWKELAIIFALACMSRDSVQQEYPPSPNKLSVSIKSDASFVISAGSNPNFSISGKEIFLQSDGKFHTNVDGTLKLQSKKPITGRDSTGTYEGTVFKFMAGKTTFVAQLLVYNQGEFVRFTQSFPDGVMASNMSSYDRVLSSFPTFDLTGKSGTKAGYLSMNDNFCGYNFNIGNLTSSSDGLRYGLRAGPLALFDGEGSTMVISAYSEFMAHNIDYNRTTGQMYYGVMGGVTEIPVDYQIDTILYYGNRGLNRAVEGWGNILTKRYKKSAVGREADFTINYLGYWTDNGAFYYYHTEKGKNYQDTMLDAMAYAKKENIPYRYIQYDSWWYYKGVQDGVVNWTAKPDVFPNGSNYLYEQIGLPVSAHNRYWASDTSYAKQNGGKYNFVVERFKAIPQDTTFWEDFMMDAKKWGLITYEQDWLDREFELMEITHTNISVGRNWLLEMGRGAQNHDITIQYCMALSRHMLQSLEIPAVTQIRASDDYQPGNDQWKVGVTSMFIHAINLAPYKDTFWTTSHQPDSEYDNDEAYPALQAAVATLTTGPVGPSDKIGYTNKDLLMKCCNMDGLILKPSRALTATDETIMKHAMPQLFPNAPNPDSEIYSTYSDITINDDSGPITLRTGIVIATDVQVVNYSVPLTHMYLDNEWWTDFIAYAGYPNATSPHYRIKFKGGAISIPKCGRKDFQLWYAAPVMKFSDGSEMAILGERAKWVPVSRKRITNVEMKYGNILMDITGAPAETVLMDFLTNLSMGKGDLKTIKCMLPNSGRARISVNAGKCISL